VSGARHVLALDQGGHASRAAVFDAAGRRLTLARREVATVNPRDGWVEQDPDELADSLLACAREVLPAAGDVPLVAGLATQRSSIVCWSRTSGAALSPVLSWQDRRAAASLAALAPAAATIRTLTGLPLSPHYGASKLRWCLDELAAVRRASASGELIIGPLASFLAQRLCGADTAFADPVNASRTLLFNVHERNWDAYLLGLFDIDRSLLPACVGSRHHFGKLRLQDRSVALELVTGDQAAAWFGTGAGMPATASVNIGTGAFLQTPCGTAPVDVPGLLCSVLHVDGTEISYNLEATVNGAGSALDAVAQELGIARAAYGASLPDWLDTVRAPPLFLNGIGGLAAPWWVADFPSGFRGQGDAGARMVAVCESIVFLLAVNLELMRATVGLERLRLGGGLAALDGICQRLADLSGLRVERSREGEATLAGVNRLLTRDYAPTPAAAVFQPRPDAALAARFRRWRDAMQRALPGDD
jgi:glycerol kinase